MRLEMKTYNIILTKKHQKYNLEKLINMNILQAKKLLPFDQSRIIRQPKFT